MPQVDSVGLLGCPETVCFYKAELGTICSTGISNACYIPNIHGSVEYEKYRFRIPAGTRGERILSSFYSLQPHREKESASQILKVKRAACEQLVEEHRLKKKRKVKSVNIETDSRSHASIQVEREVLERFRFRLRMPVRPSPLACSLLHNQTDSGLVLIEQEAASGKHDVFRAIERELDDWVDYQEHFEQIFERWWEKEEGQ